MFIDDLGDSSDTESLDEDADTDLANIVVNLEGDDDDEDDEEGDNEEQKEGNPEEDGDDEEGNDNDLEDDEEGDDLIVDEANEDDDQEVIDIQCNYVSFLLSKVDKIFLANLGFVPGFDSGCTANVALVAGDTVYVANAGDSRCIICRNGKAHDLSRDHNPSLDDERQRILRAGGYINDGRVDGNLNLSRALGDHTYKDSQMKPEDHKICGVPEINEWKLTEEDEFLVR